jgi:hypothetical protein
MLSTQRFRRIALLCLLTVFTAASVQAQEGGGRRGGDRPFGGGFGGGMMRGMQVDRAMLLRSDRIRQELKIEEAQAVTIDAALDAYREERNSTPRPDREAFEKMTEEERSAAFTKMMKDREELSKKTDEILVALLDEGQTKRLDEISLQARLTMSAIATLKADDIKQKLSITPEQVTKLDAAEAEMQATMQKAMEEARAAGGGGGGGRNFGNFEEMRARMEEMRKKSTDAALAVLTDEQKASLDSLKGAAYEIDMRSLMGGRGGPPGGGGGGGNREGGGRNRDGRPPGE